MQITPVGNYSYTTPPRFCGSCGKGELNKRETNSEFLKARGEDIFERKPDVKNNKKENAGNNCPFDSKKAMQRYKATPKLFKKYLYESIPEETRDMARKSALSGITIKKLYDEEYGENGWIFVSIGTSPAGVARALEIMGEEVRYVPISGLHHAHCSYDEIAKRQTTKKYSEFLSSIGLDKETIEKSEKKYIFCDYTSSGKTLKGAKWWAEKQEIPKSKTKFRSLNGDLMAYCRTVEENGNNKENKGGEEKSRDLKLMLMQYVWDLGYSRVGKYSGVPHLDYREIDKIDCLKRAPLDKNAGDLIYAMAYELDEAGLLK